MGTVPDDNFQRWQRRLQVFETIAKNTTSLLFVARGVRDEELNNANEVVVLIVVKLARQRRKGCTVHGRHAPLRHCNRRIANRICIAVDLNHAQHASPSDQLPVRSLEANQ